MKRLMSIFLAVLSLVILAGCSQKKQPNHIPDTWAANHPACPDPNASRVLAGPWLYEEDGYMYTLRLNGQGNGSYEWKDGSFITTCLDHQVWRGRWHQAENDREGEFEIKLADTLGEGEGRWWYTRVGEDSSPAPQGGEFQLKRIEKSSYYGRPKVRLKTSRSAR